MQDRNLLFIIAFIIISCAKYSFSLPAHFNFNGNIQKVNNLNFNSYFYGRNSVPTIQRIPTLIVESSTQNLTTFTSLELILPETEADSSSKSRPSGNACRNSTPKSERRDSDEDDDKEHDENDCIPITPIELDSRINNVPGSYDSNLSSEVAGDLILAEDEERITLYSGISPNYSYNETLDESDPPNKLISAPGCPKSADKIHNEKEFCSRHTWVHYGNPARCYLVGVRGPCKEGMLMGRQSNSFIGKCKCECFLEAPYDFIYDQLSITDPYLDEKQNFCYDGRDHLAFYEDQCYSLLTRGPCRSNEVFEIDATTKLPVCRLRECPAEENIENSHTFSLVFNGKCTKLGESCEKTANGIREEDSGYSRKLIGTTRDNPIPNCIAEEDSLQGVAIAGGAPAQITKTECKEMNQKYSKILRRCLPHYQKFRNFAIG